MRIVATQSPARLAGNAEHAADHSATASRRNLTGNSQPAHTHFINLSPSSALRLHRSPHPSAFTKK
ncbi:hypothetical protein CMV30_09340 [Nibricoccus aquaticus]|uniref:Uncharacterized protein n=1 Tax=Nibricoccus aquaticus TaxID=2576891 RepID=A0A290QJT9_9BACT|nr:hypothetical protein CMV30_09340 [Nibricoccus aquaticus]